VPVGRQLDPTMSFRQRTATEVIGCYLDYRSGQVEQEFPGALGIRRDLGSMWRVQTGRS
jgi:hypothetical protein